MLVRVSCKACHLSSIWTDDPRSFLETVCLRYRHCEAKFDEEAFASRPLTGRPIAVTTPGRLGPRRKSASRSTQRVAVPPPR